MTKKKRLDETGLPPHPGVVLFGKCLVPLRISGQQLACHIGIAPQSLNSICAKRSGITAELAWRLAYALGTNPLEWLRMQANYDLAKYRIENPPAEKEDTHTSAGNSKRSPKSAADLHAEVIASKGDLDSLYTKSGQEQPLPFGLPRDPVSPGEIMREEFLRPLGEYPQRLAKKLGVHHFCIQRVAAGTRRIKANMAWLLADAFGTSPELWMNLQNVYDLVKAYPNVTPIMMLEKVFLHNVPGLHDSVIEGMNEPLDACSPDAEW